MTHGDKISLPLTDAGRALAENVKASLIANGQSATEAIVEVAGVKLLELTVQGKRPGEGTIAADMKARKQ